MTDAETIEIMVDGVILHLGVPISKDDPVREYYRETLGAACAALTEAGLAIVSVEHVLALRAALIAGNADEAHRQLDAIMLKKPQ